MNKIDFSLGALLLVVIAPIATFPGAHWSVITLLSLAAAIFILFVVPAPRERCKRCGHYFKRTIFDRYIQRQKVKKCEDCHVSQPSDASSVSKFTA